VATAAAQPAAAAGPAAGVLAEHGLRPRRTHLVPVRSGEGARRLGGQGKARRTDRRPAQGACRCRQRVFVVRRPRRGAGRPSPQRGDGLFSYPRSSLGRTRLQAATAASGCICRRCGSRRT
jgi:hypothetical protein